MSLIELDPSWFVLESGGPIVGLSFECPHCRKQRLGICFDESAHDNMRDAYIMALSPETKHIWTKTGTDFNDISLTPSVDASIILENGGPHWHGFITNGNIT